MYHMRKFLFVHHRHIRQLEVQILSSEMVRSLELGLKNVGNHLINGMKGALQFQVILELNNDDFANQPFEDRVEKLLKVTLLKKCMWILRDSKIHEGIFTNHSKLLSQF
jgi:hypothetical protein